MLWQTQSEKGAVYPLPNHRTRVTTESLTVWGGGSGPRHGVQLAWVSPNEHCYHGSHTIAQNFAYKQHRWDAQTHQKRGVEISRSGSTFAIKYYTDSTFSTVELEESSAPKSDGGEHGVFKLGESLEKLRVFKLFVPTTTHQGLKQGISENKIEDIRLWVDTDLKCADLVS